MQESRMLQYLPKYVVAAEDTYVLRTVGAYLASALPARLPTADHACSSAYYDEIWFVV